MKHVYRQVTACRVCGYKIELVWDLGLQFIYSLERNNAAPLRLGVCTGCELVQLMDVVNPRLLYGGEYYYRSGVNDSMRKALKDVVDSALKRVELYEGGDYVIDIGSNDGTLLSNYLTRTKQITTVGFEPSRIEDVIEPTHRFHTFFNARSFNRIFKDARAKIITCCAMFYDLDDPVSFLKDVAKCLDNEGVFIIQMNYLKTMVDNCNFDNISHEHLCYYSLRDMIRITKEAGLYIEDAELNEVNGGSIRLYIRKMTDKPIGQSDRLTRLREEERVWYEEPVETYYDPESAGIKDRIANMRGNVFRIVEGLRNTIKDKRACAVGASTRGYVILQYASIELPLIDRNPDKVGRSLGNMPILGEEHIDDYEVGLVLPYHFIDEFKVRYKDFLKAGGKLLKPLPEFEEITYDNAAQVTGA